MWWTECESSELKLWFDEPKTWWTELSMYNLVFLKVHWNKKQLAWFFNTKIMNWIRFARTKNLNADELILMNWIWIQWTKIWDNDEYFKWSEYESSELVIWWPPKFELSELDLRELKTWMFFSELNFKIMMRIAVNRMWI